MKKVLALLLVIALMIPVSAVSAATLRPDANIKVFLEGKRLSFDIDPVQTQGTTLVQFTTIFKALGLKYTWDQETKTINGYNEELQLRLTINDPISNVNGYNILLNVAPTVYQNKTLVPLRFVSEATGMKVTWNAAAKTINIDNNPNRELIEVPSLDPFTFGAQAGDSPKAVEKLVGVEGTNLYGDDIYSYDAEFLGYDTELNFDFIDEELFSVSYYYGQEGMDDHFFTVYSDMYDELEAYFGVANEYAIYNNSIEEDAAYEVIDWDIPAQVLESGIKNGDYLIEAYWDLPQGFVVLTLYPADNGEVIIEALFIPQL